MLAAEIIIAKILEWRQPDKPLTVGLCGPQGSGKSTIAGHVADGLAQFGLQTISLSLDDFYVGRAARAELAAKSHALFATRGPPGTHDVALGIGVLDALIEGRAVFVPRFDKGEDNPAPRESWKEAVAPHDVILFEGWCVGALPEDEAVLINPVNALERREDSEGKWRSAANIALAGAYQRLWARIDRLVLLQAPDFSVIATWRSQQEQALVKRGAPHAMNDAQIARFVQHYERLTLHIASEMPARADLVIALDHRRQVTRRPS